jgi:hypothetical protein
MRPAARYTEPATPSVPSIPGKETPAPVPSKVGAVQAALG